MPVKILILGPAARYGRYRPPMEFIDRQELVFLDKESTEAQIIAAGGEAEVLFADAITPVSAALMAGLPRLRMIHSEGVAFDRIDLSAARERGWLNDGDLLLAGYNDAIPRQLAAKLLVCALELKPSAEITALPFLDAADIDGAYLSYVTTAYVSGLFQGDSDGNFYPEGSVTRGAGATLIYRAVHLGEEPSEEEPPEESGGITYEGYTAQQVKDHFITCALGAEYGDSTPVVKKWTEPLYYAYAGTPMEGDVEYLESFMAALNGIEGFPGIYPAGEHTPNLTIHFVDDEAAMEAATGHTNLNGYASIWWYNGSYQIYQGDVYYLGTTPDYERKSVLIEELYQVMGILNDTYSYPESLIYQYYTEADWPCALDWAIMQLLYHPDIRSGMSEDQCVEVIDKLL